MRLGLRGEGGFGVLDGEAVVVREGLDVAGDVGRSDLRVRDGEAVVSGKSLDVASDSRSVLVRDLVLDTTGYISSSGTRALHRGVDIALDVRAGVVRSGVRHGACFVWCVVFFVRGRYRDIGVVVGGRGCVMRD